jgi:hypothetical protein
LTPRPSGDYLVLSFAAGSEESLFERHHYIRSWVTPCSSGGGWTFRQPRHPCAVPWPRRSLVSIREELILKVLAKEDSVVELAQQYGVSRKTNLQVAVALRLEGIVRSRRRVATSEALADEDVRRAGARGRATP